VNRFLLACTALGVALTVSSVTKAATTTINFADYDGENLTSLDGVTFSLGGGPGPGGPPCVCSFGTAAMGNSANGAYPTSAYLQVTFADPANDVSFSFNNFGYAPEGYPVGSGSYFDAFSLGDDLISSGYIGDICPTSGGGTVDVPGNEISLLELNNNTDGRGDWEFGVYSLTFTPAPEPASLALLSAGVAVLALVRCPSLKGRVKHQSAHF
jgi:hypothetical protein